MASFFFHIFACCLRGRSGSEVRSPCCFDERRALLTLSDVQGEPDERSHLIPPTNDVPPTRNYVVDRQKLSERLGTIVRSKEGKMVNVNAPLPFNLHNKALHTLDPSHSHSHSQPRTTPPRPLTTTQNRGPSYSPTRDPSPSIQTSRSTSSLHPGDASYLPPEADPDGGTRRPILNVRLVRCKGGYAVGGRRIRQGRSATRGRLGRFGEARNGNEDANGDANGAASEAPNGKGKEVCDSIAEDQAATTPESDNLATPMTDGDTSPHAPTESPNTSPESQEMFDGVLDEATPQQSDFMIQIQDVGKISQSWGD
ncbi:hypothetical protein AcW1_008645 [Taiwanofungus camphoratus]|nr:hypothetical protein AcW1_008645 [Antrodia cinnamomea]